MKIKATYLFLMFCLGLKTFTSAQTTITLKPANGTGKDAVIGSFQPATNAGNSTDLSALTWTCGGPLCLGRGLIQFDLSLIPSNATVTAATLSLSSNTTSANGIPGQPMYGTSNGAYVRRITQVWNENLVTWNNQPATTTLNQAVLPQSTSGSQNYSVDVQNLVQDMVNDPAGSFGFMIQEQDEVNYYNSLIFCSSDHADSALAPELVVTYVIGASNCITLQPGAVDGKDASIGTFQPSTNAGSSVDLSALTWTCGGPICLGRGLIEFDLSTIPSNAVIDSAYLTLFANTTSANGIAGQPMYGTDNAAYVRRVTQNWNENSVTWNNQPSFSLQNEVVLPQSTSPTQDYVVNVKNMVQDMILNPLNSFGFLIMEQNESTWYNSLIFCSSDHNNPAVHPILKVCYVIPSGVNDMKLLSNSISLFPNPSADRITVDCGFTCDSYELHDVTGNLLDKKLVASSKFEIDLNRFDSGIYLLTVANKEIKIHRKIVKD
jgi:hypothetical protein